TSRTQTASSTRVSRRASLPDTRASVPGTRALLPGTGVCPPDSGALPSDTRVSFPCGSGPPFLGADSVDPFERRGQGEGGAVADLVGDRGEGGVGVAEAVRGQGETPGGQVRHRRFADQLGETAGQGGAGDARLRGEGG